MTELEQAISRLEKELASTPETDRARVAELLSRLGSNLEGAGQRERALEVLHRSLRIMEDMKDVAGATDVRNRIGAVLIAMDRLDEARPVLDRALSSTRQHGLRMEEATSLNNLAIADDMSGDLERARQRYERSIEILRTGGASSKLATTLSNLGVVYGGLGHVDAAREVWREALALHKKLGYDAGLASALNNVALFLADHGHRSEALEYFEKAVALQQRIGDKGELALILGNRSSTTSAHCPS